MLLGGLTQCTRGALALRRRALKPIRQRIDTLAPSLELCRRAPPLLICQFQLPCHLLTVGLEGGEFGIGLGRLTTLPQHAQLSQSRSIRLPRLPRRRSGRLCFGSATRPRRLRLGSVALGGGTRILGGGGGGKGFRVQPLLLLRQLRRVRARFALSDQLVVLA